MADDTQGTVAAEIAYLRAVAGAIRADESAVAFDLGTVMGRFDRAVAALGAVLKLADTWDDAAAAMHEQLGVSGMVAAGKVSAAAADPRHPRAVEIREAITRELAAEEGLS